MCQAVQRAVEDLCSRTELVTTVLHAGRLRKGQARYPIPVPQGQRILRCLQAWSGATPLPLVAASEVGHPTLFTGNAAGQTGQVGAAHVVDRALMVYPAPASDGEALTVRVALAPDTEGGDMPPVLFEPPWLDVVVAGARWILTSVPGQVFSSMEHAAVAKAEFEQGVLRARSAALRGPVKAGMRVRSRPIA